MSRSHHRANPHSAFLLIGAIFLLIVVAIFLKRRKKSHKSSSVSRTPLEHINHRKETLKRYVNQLEKQLSMRKNQLQNHEQLEEIVTARVNYEENLEKREEEWDVVMARGRELYGDCWDNGKGDQLPLSTLMTMHKQELQLMREEAIQQGMKQDSKKEKQNRQKVKIKKEVQKQNEATLTRNHGIIEQENERLLGDNGKNSSGTTIGHCDAIVHPNSFLPSNLSTQWKSNRHLGISQIKNKNLDDNVNTASLWSKNNLIQQQEKGGIGSIPVLDLSKINMTEPEPDKKGNIQHAKIPHIKKDKDSNDNSIEAYHRRNKIKGLFNQKHKLVSNKDK